MLKKISIFCFLACLIASPVIAVDFSNKSLSELLEIQSKITEAIWKSPDFKEAIVPQGIYKVGRDIPAGRWSVEFIGTPSFDYIKTYAEYINGNLKNSLETQYFSNVDTTITTELIAGTDVKITQKCKFKTFVPMF